METIVLIAVLLVGICDAQYGQLRDEDCPERCHCTKPSIYNISDGTTAIRGKTEILCTIYNIEYMEELPHNMTSLIIDNQCQNKYSWYFVQCIDRLEEDIFANFTQLKSLVIRNTNLRTLPDGIFNRTRNLEQLELANNPLNFHSDSQLFTPLKNLIKLTISNSDVVYFGKTFFRGLDNLRDLDLHNNSIRCFPYHHYTHMPELTNLRLSSNRLISFHYSGDFGSSKLEEISLKNNKIESLYIYWLNTGNLRRVYLKGNKLKCSCKMYQNILNVGYYGNVFVDGECTLPFRGNNSTKYRLTQLPEFMKCREIKKEHC